MTDSFLSVATWAPISTAKQGACSQPAWLSADCQSWQGLRACTLQLAATATPRNMYTQSPSRLQSPYTITCTSLLCCTSQVAAFDSLSALPAAARAGRMRSHTHSARRRRARTQARRSGTHAHTRTHARCKPDTRTASESLPLRGSGIEAPQTWAHAGTSIMMKSGLAGDTQASYCS